MATASQVVPISPSTNAEAYRASTDAAGLCKAIVVKTAARIQGKRYVTVEGWQAIAIAHGCTASADHVERVNDEGMSGFKATGIIRRMADGAEIARAEGFLGDDEGTWSRRPVYARRAMAQTRAISRACRSAFAHVVVMMDAGLATTPAEEIPHDPETGEVIEATIEPIKGIHKIKERLRVLQAGGNEATTLQAFNDLVRENADDLQKIKDANHSWWTGDGEDFEGFKTWIVRRRAELAEPEDGGIVSGLIASMKECETKLSLSNWYAANEAVIDQLDGAESRKFQLAYELHESTISTPAAEPAHPFAGG